MTRSAFDPENVPEPGSAADWEAACRLAVEQRDILRAQLGQVRDLCTYVTHQLNDIDVVTVADLNLILEGP